MAHEHQLLTPEQAAIAVDYVRHKTTRLTWTAKFITDEGKFSGYASTFGDVFGETDLQGDVVHRHAFDGTLQRWRKRGVWPPLLYNHDISVAGSMGVISNLFVDGKGLVLQGTLDLEHPPAAALHRAMKAKRITGLSISYAILDEERQRDGTNLLLDLELIEISVTPVPANQDAQILQVKGSTSTSASTFGGTTTTTWTPPEPEWKRELKSLNDRLDALEHGQRLQDADDVVDAFVTAVRQEMVEEKLAEAEQAAWERRMLINVVLDPVPVRVDARMRPDR